MKSLLYLFAACIVIASGCSKRDQESDAYGNFTATEILVSSEIAGKVLVKNVMEGETIDSLSIAYIIDTLQNSLKKDGLIASKKSVAAKKTNLSAQIAVLQEQNISLEQDFKRFSKMFKEGAASQKQVDDISNNLKVLEKQIEQVRSNYASVDAEISAMNASIAQVEDLIKRAVVCAPSAGTVLETYAEAGESVTPGKYLFKLANLKQMELRAYFSGNQLTQIKTGQEVEIRVDNGTDGIRTMKGIISWISEDAEFTPKIIQTREERVNLVYAVKIMVKNDGSIKINMPGEVKIIKK